MTYSALLSGMGFGVLVAAPVGPMALLCITRTLRHGAPSGFATGLGIATADRFFAAIAAFGFDLAAPSLDSWRHLLQIAGGAFLLIVAVRSMFADNMTAAKQGSVNASHHVAYLSALGLTLANPPTILIFSAMFAGLVTTSSSTGSPGLLTLGVFVGSTLWWIALVSLAARLRQRFSGVLLKWITTIAAIALGGLGAVMVFRAAATMLE